MQSEICLFQKSDRFSEVSTCDPNPIKTTNQAKYINIKKALHFELKYFKCSLFSILHAACFKCKQHQLGGFQRKGTQRENFSFQVNSFPVGKSTINTPYNTSGFRKPNLVCVQKIIWLFLFRILEVIDQKILEGDRQGKVDCSELNINNSNSNST